MNLYTNLDSDQLFTVSVDLCQHQIFSKNLFGNVRIIISFISVPVHDLIAVRK